MDLRGMLNDAPSARKTPEQIKKELRHDADKKTVLNLLTTFKYAVAKDALKQKDMPKDAPLPTHGGMHSSPYMQSGPAVAGAPANIPLPPADCRRLGIDLVHSEFKWGPKLSFGLVAKERRLVRQGAGTLREYDTPVQLVGLDIYYRGNEPRILLEDEYEIKGANARGLYVLLAKRGIQESFVFKYPDHPWFENLYGLRQSAYIMTRTEDGTPCELHLKGSSDRKYLFGYLCRPRDRESIVQGSMEEILGQNRLPLVLDLDDTLVRLVGEGNERYVPARDLDKCSDRIAVLKDGKRVVLAERVREFLEWAEKYYDISICSLGEQDYVNNVIDVLDPQRVDPQRAWIRGNLYSARSEHNYIKQSFDPGRPPKDLRSLYSFCELTNGSPGSAFSLPLILDDETRMWPTEQHDNIIVVKGQENVGVWNVSLFPAVRDTLFHVHQEFFRQYEIFRKSGKYIREPPSARAIYKTYLRHMLRDQIARDPRT